MNNIQMTRTNTLSPIISECAEKSIYEAGADIDGEHIVYWHGTKCYALEEVSNYPNIKNIKKQIKKIKKQKH